jgi:hypothetical protein
MYKLLDAFLFIERIQANTFNKRSFELVVIALNVKAKVKENKFDVVLTVHRR